MYCNYCGKVIQDDANHCAYCGTRVGGVMARKKLIRPRVMTGVGLLSYPIAWIVMPEEPEVAPQPVGQQVTS